ncbi:hypothetical protein [Microcoleus sp. FACHB-831]|nr:hypothetical protein [Microcoleus sp. FACHB-831]
MPLKLESGCTPLKISAIARRDIFLSGKKAAKVAIALKFVKI